jgi:hypothetical protein
MNEFIEVQWADLHEYCAKLKEQFQRRDEMMHARINDRVQLLDWAIAEQELKTAYIKRQHSSNPF